MAGDEHESHVLVLLFLLFILGLNYLKVDNQDLQDSKHLKQVLNNKLKEQVIRISFTYGDIYSQACSYGNCACAN